MKNSFDEESLLQRWHDRIGRHRPYGRRRPFAAMGCFVPTGSTGFLELNQLLLVLLFDEPIGRRLPALRLVGYRASQVAHGVLWGGIDGSELYKDLRCEPVFGGHGLVVDSSCPEFMHLALQLHEDLNRVDRFQPKGARKVPQLPRLWAGFAPADAESLAGDGPEFEALCERFDLEPQAMLRKFQREHNGFCCLPTEWVGGELQRSLAMFVDLSEAPRRQVFRLPAFPESLQGFLGAAQFDFYHSRLRQRFELRLKQRQENLARKPDHVLMEESIAPTMEVAASP